MKDERNGSNTGKDSIVLERGLSRSFGASARPIVTVDVAKYQALLDGSDLSPAQKEEFLQALWSIVVTFVDLGFGVHPLQEVCGQDSEDELSEVKLAFDQVESGKLDQSILFMGTSPKDGLEVE